jgi:hypothetical protein
MLYIAIVGMAFQRQRREIFIAAIQTNRAKGAAQRNIKCEFQLCKLLSKS